MLGHSAVGLHAQPVAQASPVVRRQMYLFVCLSPYVGRSMISALAVFVAWLFFFSFTDHFHNSRQGVRVHGSVCVHTCVYACQHAGAHAVLV